MGSSSAGGGGAGEFESLARAMKAAKQDLLQRMTGGAALSAEAVAVMADLVSISPFREPAGASNVLCGRWSVVRPSTAESQNLGDLLQTVAAFRPSDFEQSCSTVQWVAETKIFEPHPKSSSRMVAEWILEYRDGSSSSGEKLFTVRARGATSKRSPTWMSFQQSEFVWEEHAADAGSPLNTLEIQEKIDCCFGYLDQDLAVVGKGKKFEEALAAGEVQLWCKERAGSDGFP